MLATILLFTQGPALAEEKTKTVDLEQFMSKLEKENFIMGLNIDQNYVLIDPSLWEKMTYTEKQDTARKLAMYCAAKNQNLSEVENGEGWVLIKNGYNNQELGKYKSPGDFKLR